MKTTMDILKRGFTLIELMVVVAIIAVLAGLIYANFGDARSQSNDQIRKTDLLEVQVSLELYKGHNGKYPAAGCSAGTDWTGASVVSASGFKTCANYIDGLAPVYIPKLPVDEKNLGKANVGYFYKTNTDRTAYKLIALDSIEVLTVDSYDHKLARCPKQGGACTGTTPPANTYAVYSRDAGDW